MTWFLAGVGVWAGKGQDWGKGFDFSRCVPGRKKFLPGGEVTQAIPYSSKTSPCWWYLLPSGRWK